MKKTLVAIIALVGLVFASCSSSVDTEKKTEAETTNIVDNGADTPEETPAVEQHRFLSADLTFFCLYGPVKKVEEDGLVCLEFDKNGELTKDYGTPASERYKRDGQGRIVEMDGYENHVVYEWDEAHPIGSKAAAEGMTLLESYTYDERGFVVKIKHTDDGEESVETFTYSDLDSHGNWTKRTSEGYGYTAGTTTRVIEYYEQ